MAFGNAAQFAMDEFNLAVTNVVAGLRQDQFFCSGSLLRTEIKEPKHPRGGGFAATAAGDVRTQSGVRHQAGVSRQGARRYPKDRNPLLSGFLLGAGLIQGKAAALDAEYGTGHIILLGFRPQWRGQSHGTYKFFFNALFYNPSMAPEAKPARAAGAEAVVDEAAAAPA